MWKDPAKRGRLIKKFAEVHSRPELKARHSEIAKSMWQDPIKREQLCASHKTYSSRPEVKARLTKRMHKMWQNPEYRKARTQESVSRFSQPEFKAKALAGNLASWGDPNKRLARIAKAAEFWIDPSRRTARIAKMQNLPPRTATGYKGTYFSHKKFMALITIEKKSIYLGLFPTLELAARAYDAAALKHYGPGCYLNFPLNRGTQPREQKPAGRSGRQ